MRYAPRDIYTHAEEYIAHCRRHPCSSRISALKIGLWGLKRALFPRDTGLKKKSEFSDKNLHVAFILEGGIGDIVINANYIENFIRIASCPVVIDIYAGQKKDILQSIFGNKVYISNIMGDKPLQYAYDAVIDMLYMPKLLRADEGRLTYLGGEKLNDCLINMRRFAAVFPEWVSSRSCNFVGLFGYARIRGLNRNRLASAGNMEEGFDENLFSLSVPAITPDVLERFPFLNAPFIAVNRSVGSSRESTKLWSVKEYQNVLTRIKEQYPAIPLIRIGSETGEIQECNVNICGKTTFNELMIILSSAMLLVSNEGGLVHLRHFLHGGKSTVLFCSTDKNFYGYQENENIGKNCHCEWFHHRWQEFCVNTYSNL